MRKSSNTGIHYFKFQSSRLFQLYQVKKIYDYDSFFVICEDINLNITVTEVILKIKNKQYSLVAI